MSLQAPNYTLPPRSSTETDRRHLLADSIAPSESASVLHHGPGDATPRAHSPSRLVSGVESAFKIPAGQPRRDTIADPTPTPYRGFPSEAHYLAALQRWADDKKYMDTTHTTLYGFYGDQTVEDYRNRPRPEGLGLRKMWKERRASKQEQKQRRGTIA